MKNIHRIAALVILAVASIALTGCNEAKGPAEKVGDKVDDALNQRPGEKVRDVVEDIKK